MLRRRRQRRSAPETGAAPGVDLAGLQPRWRAPVEETVAARARFRSMLATVPPGPVADRLAELAERVDAGVLASYQIAARAQTVEAAVPSLDPERVTADLKAARRRLDDARASGVGDVSSLEAEVELLTAQHGSVNRVLNELEDAAERLRMLDLRLDGAVARAAELALRPVEDASSSAAGGIDAELDALVADLDALRSALDELGPR